MKLLFKIIFIITGLLFVVGMSYKIGIGAAYGKFDWEKLTPEEARKTLGAHIDAAKIPHGDLAVPSNKAHSRRYIISQWQRVAAGAIVVVLSYDADGDLVLALGNQRGKLVPPQGYMEAKLPKDDLTGLRAKGASRLNGSNGKIIKADRDLKENAAREVKEELGIDINQNDLVLIGVAGSEEVNPIVHTVAVHYAIMLDKDISLKVTDHEFIDDDLNSPKWFKVRDIKCKEGVCNVAGEIFPIREDNISIIQKAIKHFVAKSKLGLYTHFLNFKTQN